jgi:hypothetical protein
MQKDLVNNEYEIDDFNIYTQIGRPIETNDALRPSYTSEALYRDQDRLNNHTSSSNVRPSQMKKLLTKGHYPRWSAGGAASFLEGQRKNNNSRYLIKYSAGIRQQSAKQMLPDQISQAKSNPFLEGQQSFKVLRLNSNH